MAAQCAGVATVEARERAADVPDVVGVAASRHRKHPFDVAERGPRVVDAGKDARVIDDLDGVHRQVRDERGQWPMPDAVMRNRMERMGRHGQATLRSEEHTSELQSRSDLVCRLLLEKKNIPGAGLSATVTYIGGSGGAGALNASQRQ